MRTLSKYSNYWAIIIILLQTFFILMVNHYVYIEKSFYALERLLPYIDIIIAVLTVLIILSIKKHEENTKKITEVSLLKEHLSNIETLLTLLQSQKHEHTRHIQTLQAMIYLGEIEAAESYLEELVEEYWYLQDTIQVGHPALTALLNTKQQVGESKGIEFAFNVKCDLSRLHVNSWELCSILGNLIDNALEAVLPLKGKKRVSVEIKKENGYINFYVSNSGVTISEKNSTKIFNAGYTTKLSEARGYGLHLVKKLVSKYNGNIKVILKEKTTFIVSIPVKGDKGDKKAVLSSGASH